MADIATLGLRVEANERDIDEVRRKLDQIGASGDKAEKSAANLGRTLRTVGTAIAGAWITREIIQNTIEAQNAIAILDARIRSTGGAAGKSRADLEAMASSLQRLTTFEDEAVMGAQAMLLTFKQIKGDEFDRATKVTLDLAAAMGTDARSAALQLGKALEDPEVGLTALRRSGISFTEAQRDQITAMVDAGRVAEAQTLILGEMETQVGGTAAALRDTLGGALLGLKNAFGDTLEVSGANTRALVDALNALTSAIPRATTGINDLFDKLTTLIYWYRTARAELYRWQAALELNIPGRSEEYARLLRMAADTEQAIRDMFAPDTIAGVRSLAEVFDDVTASVQGTAAAMREVQVTIGDISPAVGGPAGGLTANRMLGGFGHDFMADQKVWMADYIVLTRQAGEEMEGAADDFGRAWGVAIAGAARELDGFASDLAAIGGAAATGGAQAAMAATGNLVFGLLGEMFSRRDEAEMRKVYEANTEALRNVAKNLEGFATQLTGMSGSQVQDFRDVLEWLQGGRLGGISTSTLSGVGKFLGVDTSGRYDQAALVELIQQILGQALEQVQRQVGADFAARQAALAGNDIEAARIRREAAAAKELAELQKLADAGFLTAEQMAQFAAIIRGELTKALEDATIAAAKAAEEQERAARDAARAIEEEVVRAFEEMERAARAAAEATLQLVESLTERALRLTGQGGAADTFGLAVRQRRERAEAAGQSPDVLALLDFVHTQERAELARQQAMAAINDGLELQLAALNEQIRIEEEAFEKQDAAYADQIEIAEAQLRVQEQTVDALRKVVENLREYRLSLLTSTLSQLSPVQQLEVARDRFTGMAGKAFAGDVAAGQGLPDAARTFLEISRRVNASGANYQSDWDAVHNILFTVEGRFGQQLSIEEQMLASMQNQIAELQAARDLAQVNHDQAMANLREQMADAEREADRLIAQLQEEARQAAEAAAKQLAALLEQIRVLTTIGTQLTDQGGGIIDIKPDLLLITENTAASVNVLQVGFSGMLTRLESVEAGISGLRNDMRRGLELNV